MVTKVNSTVINEPYSGVVPIGGIIMYSGAIAALPSGWAFCNGTNGTPDLRDKFIIGAAADSSGQANTTVTGSTTKTGGSKDAVTVSHTHTATVTDPGHAHNSFGSGNPNGSAAGSLLARDGWNVGTNWPTRTNTTGITVSNSTTGESGTNKNLPPYYALAFIMRIS